MGTVIDTEIARNWPKQWARANDPSKPGASKRRNNIRRAYRQAQEFKAWRAKHPTASCAGCAHARPYTDRAFPFTCDLEATSGCIQPVAADHICMWWRKRK